PSGIHDPPCGPVIIVTCCAATGNVKAAHTAAPRPAIRASFIVPPGETHGASKGACDYDVSGLCGQRLRWSSCSSRPHPWHVTIATLAGNLPSLEVLPGPQNQNIRDSAAANRCPASKMKRC